MLRVKHAVSGFLFAAAMGGLLTSVSTGQVVTEVLDVTGDGSGNSLVLPQGIAVDSAGNVYVVGLASRNVFRIATTGVVTQVIDESGDGNGNFMIEPQGIAIDGADNVYVTGTLSDNAFKITPAGVITEIIDATGDGNGNVLDRPEDIATGPSGNVYVAGDDSDNVFRITPAGHVTEIIDAAAGGGFPLDGPEGLAVDGSENVFVMSYGGGGTDTGRVFKVTPAGGISEVVSDLDAPHGIAVDASGNLFVANFLRDSALKVTPDGIVTTIINANGDGNGNTLDGTRSVAVDDAGNVYVTGYLGHNAFRVTPAGEVTEILDASGDGGGNVLTRPEDVAVDASGNVYVSGTVSNNVFRIDLQDISYPAFCNAADGALASCPCGNTGAPDTGCDIQQQTGGVLLAVVKQVTSLQNRVSVTGTGFPVSTTPTAIVLRDFQLEPVPVVFGDGIRCVGVPLVRLAATFASGGVSTHSFGHGVMAGAGDFYYQIWFRNAPAMYCTPGAFNLSNGVTLTW